MRIAVVHDYFTQLGGAEKVAEELVRMLPSSTLHATVALPECMPPHLADVHVETTWMQHLPRIKQYYRFYFLLYPLAVQSLDVTQYDLVISSSSGYAKGVRTGRDSVHVCYCHTPMRWAWSFDNYSAREEMGRLKRLVLPYMAGALRKWDIGASRQPDHFVANSKTVADRIYKAYGRVAKVIHPPIDIDRFSPCGEQEDYYLVLSRLISYKRIDLAIEACTLLNRRLVVIGDGPDRPRLEAKAGPTVTFMGRLEDNDVEYYAARCRALIFTGEEDFGMVPLEIAAAGRPTIAYRGGGAIETILEGETGVFFDQPCAEDLARAIKHSEGLNWNPEALRKHAQTFGIEVFRASFRDFFERIGCPIKQGAALHLAAPAAVPYDGRALTDVPGYRHAQGY